MPKKVYVKDQSFDPIFKTVNLNFYFKSKILSGGLVALGFLILGTQVVLPLVFFKTQDSISEPIRKTALGRITGFDDFQFNELRNEEQKNTLSNGTVPENFLLSIPKLRIKDAVVETNSTNLSPEETLGHYRGSGLPGEVGNAFIYGHSVLPWFYNPKNYKTIFSTIDTLQPGDEVYLTYNNRKLKYKVEAKEIQFPDKVNPLAEYKPRYLNESTITLMTCYPAGTRAKRLMVYAILVE